MTITHENQNFWKNNSYLVIRNLFKDSINQISDWVNEVASWGDDYSRWLTFYEMDNPSTLSRIENFVPYHNGLNEILRGNKMLRLVSELMGSDALLYKERINFKPPNGGAHSAHQDGVAYEQGMKSQFDTDSIPYISILVSVDKATEENGCFEVVPDWPMDKLDILPMEQPYPGNPSFSKIAQSVEDRLHWEKLVTEPGDVVFFTERLPHRSARNTSSKARRILYGVYNPASDGDKHTTYFEQKRKNINDKRYMVGNPHAEVDTKNIPGKV